MEQRFVTSERTFSYFNALESYLHKHGRPVAFYSYKHTVFREAKPDNLKHAMNVNSDQLAVVLCWRENRYVGKQLTFLDDRKRVMLEEYGIAHGLVGKYVDTYAFVDGRVEVRSKGRSLPYTIFDMDQRVTHAAIADNKRLSAVLEHIKQMQDAAPPKSKVRTNSEKMGTSQTGGGGQLAGPTRRRSHTPRNSFISKVSIRRDMVLKGRRKSLYAFPRSS